MPLKKVYIPQKPNFLPLEGTQTPRTLPLSPGPILVPVSQPAPTPTPGAFSNAFSNAFNV